MRTHWNCDGPTWTRCRQSGFPLSGIRAVWNSDTPTALPAYIAWPAKNATNAVTSEITSVTDVNAIALAA